MRNPIAEQKIIEQEIREDLKKLADTSREMLSDGRFKRIKEIFEKAETNTINLLLRYKEDDPYKFKSKVSEFLIELNVYRNLLQAPEDLAKETPKPNINFMQRFLTDFKKDLASNML